jgi:hypothetical protein
MFAHEMNRSRKLLLKTTETGQSSLANRMVRFCHDRCQLGAPPGFDEVCLLWPSDVRTEEKQEP